MIRSLAFLSIFLGAACSQLPAGAPVVEVLEGDLCQTQVFRVDADFSAANMASCKVVDESAIEVLLQPEDTPINPSPWYAVRLTPNQPGSVRLILRYEEHPHRYKPKVSFDGAAWIVLPDDRVDVKAEGYRVILDLDLDTQPLFVSAQELYTNAAHDAWIRAQAEKPFVTMSEIGTSIEGRPISMIRTEASLEAPKTVMMTGRQHPPEIPGALAYDRFVEEVLSDTELANTFRSQFDLIMIPNINPDGVEHGHWRHNKGGLDLNRDWGPFTQPETQAVKAVIDSIESPGLALFLDFHSTSKNVYYTQPLGNDGTEYDFTESWLNRGRVRLPQYVFERQGSHNLALPTSKTYIFETYGIPAITYEVGDETDRAEAIETARVLAQEMMLLLLEHE
ncbi:MAG: M14 family metallopeptidase [Pseudomonadota bacterium]